MNSSTRGRAEAFLRLPLGVEVIDLVGVISRRQRCRVELDEISAGTFGKAWHVDVECDPNYVSDHGQSDGINKDPLSGYQRSVGEHRKPECLAFQHCNLPHAERADRHMGRVAGVADLAVTIDDNQPAGASGLGPKQLHTFLRHRLRIATAL